jgi:hypothetical protein
MSNFYLKIIQKKIQVSDPCSTFNIKWICLAPVSNPKLQIIWKSCQHFFTKMSTIPTIYLTPFSRFCLTLYGTVPVFSWVVWVPRSFVRFYGNKTGTSNLKGGSRGNGTWNYANNIVALTLTSILVLSSETCINLERSLRTWDLIWPPDSSSLIVRYIITSIRRSERGHKYTF